MKKQESTGCGGASDNTLLGKFPATKGKFYKTIIAGHVGTCSRDLAADRSYHDVYYDGESHYYIYRYSRNI